MPFGTRLLAKPLASRSTITHTKHPTVALNLHATPSADLTPC
jgi:hypothetical protein